MLIVVLRRIPPDLCLVRLRCDAPRQWMVSLQSMCVLPRSAVLHIYSIAAQAVQTRAHQFQPNSEQSRSSETRDHNGGARHGVNRSSLVSTINSLGWYQVIKRSNYCWTFRRKLATLCSHDFKSIWLIWWTWRRSHGHPWFRLSSKALNYNLLTGIALLSAYFFVDY